MNKILIVEDEKHLLNLYKHELEDEGMKALQDYLAVTEEKKI